MERLQRIMAARGVASRRAAEELIRAGRVTLDGNVVTELGTKADPVRAVIRVDGKLLKTQRPRYILLNKPRGYITTVKDERDRRTVMDLVTVPERVFPVGRLDRDTEGLLLLTNDGDVANRVMHPRYGLDKEYQVLTFARPPDAVLQRLRDGVRIDGKLVVPDDVRIARETNEGLILKVVVHEGINHLVRRMMEEVGITLERLRRVRLGPLSIAAVPVGVWRELTPGELENLLQAVQLDQVDDAAEETRARKYRSARSEARRTEPASPRRGRDTTLDELPDQRLDTRPPRPHELESPRRAPRGDRFALMRQARRERRQPAEGDQRDQPPVNRERGAGRPRNERDERRVDDRADHANPRREQHDGDAQSRFAGNARHRYANDHPRGSERQGDRDERRFERSFARRDRDFDRDAGQPGRRPAGANGPGRRDDFVQRGEVNPRRQRGDTRWRDDERRPPNNERDERSRQRFAGGDQGAPDRRDRFDQRRDGQPRHAADAVTHPRRPPGRPERDEPARSGSRAPRRPFGNKDVDRRFSPDQLDEDPRFQRGAEDDQDRQAPPGDRDRRASGGRKNDRRPRARRPPGRDLP